MDTLHGQEARDKVWDLIKDIKVAQMGTWNNQTHVAHARPMMAQHVKDSEFDGVLWFFTNAASRKADEIEDSAQVLLAYADPGAQKYVSLSGTANIVQDRAKIDELWTEAAGAWFPKGKDDPNVALIRFEAEDAEFWEVPGGTLAAGFGYLKAMVTGGTPDVGESGKVHLTH